MRTFALISVFLAAVAPARAIAQEPGTEFGNSDSETDSETETETETDSATDSESDSDSETETGSGTVFGSSVSDAESESDADSDSEPRLSSSETADAPTAKVAVVVVGDPDDDLRDRARELDRLLSRHDDLVLPSDSGLRGALRGDPEPDEDDGLGRVRRQRRTLGLDDAEDAGGLTALGRVSGAVAVIVLRRRAGSIHAAVQDVASARLYEGELDLTGADDDAIVRFVLPRARASSLRAAEREAEAAEEGSWREAAGARGDRQRARTEEQEGDDDEAEEEDDRGFFAKYWPYLVAGVLLAGALIYAFTVDTTPDTPPPVLRFLPGGN